MIDLEDRRSLAREIDTAHRAGAAHCLGHRKVMR